MCKAFGLMDAPEDPAELIPEPRPLPSLHMPLLRDAVAASKRRKWTVGVTAILATSIFVAGWWVGPRVRSWMTGQAPTSPAVPPTVGIAPTVAAPVEAPPVPAVSQPASPPIEAAAPGERRIDQPFGNATGLSVALSRLGLSGPESEALIRGLGDLVDARRCRPEHVLTSVRDASGHLTRFEYRTSEFERVVAQRNGNAFVATRESVPLELVRLARGGVVTQSLGDAFEALGLSRNLAGVVVSAFEGRINFSTEARRGDTFRMVMEEERANGRAVRQGRILAIEYNSQARGTLAAYYFAPRGSEGDYFDATGRALHGGWIRTPLVYDRISDGFNPNRMHPILRRVHPHNGIDFAAGTGTPIWAAADGVVTFFGDRGPNGNLIILRHEGGYESFYAHLSRFARGLRVGQPVTQRQVIGYVGTTGRSTGPHLHFGLKHRGHWVDPARELNGPGRMLPAASLARFRTAVAGYRAELARVSLAEGRPSAAAPAGRVSPVQPSGMD